MKALVEQAIHRWEFHRTRYEEEQATGRLDVLCARFIQDLGALLGVDPTRFTMSEAAAWSGYSRRQLTRLVQQGRLSNVGRPGAPLVLRSDLEKLRPRRGSLRPPASRRER